VIAKLLGALERTICALYRHDVQLIPGDAISKSRDPKRDYSFCGRCGREL
jgi:hypothetical protein